MPTASTEVERTYDVDDAALLPQLLGLPGVERVAQPEVLELEAVYYDTAGLELARSRRTLRRRRGGHDDGWTLKSPAGDGARTEHTMPPTAGTRPPKELLEPVRGIVRDHPLRVVTRIGTRRTLHALLDVDGRRLAEVADDVVRSTGPDGPKAWREWEVELVDGPVELLAAVEERLRAAGARPAAVTSKQARALGSVPAPPRLPRPRRKGSVGDLLRAYLAEHAARLVALDEPLRTTATADPVAFAEAVHRARISARRLRSALAAGRRLLADDATRPLEAELRWLGRQLGDARDAHVTGERLDGAVRDLPAELVLGDVADRLDTHFRDAGRTTAAGITRTLAGRRYYRLLDDLDALVTDLPLGRRGRVSVAAGLPPLLRREWRRVDRRARAALAAQAAGAPTAEVDPLLHATRKAAKRLRYVAELAAPVAGGPAKRLAASAHHVQQLLGRHQDAVVAQPLLRTLGVQAHLAGQNGFTYGLLLAEQHRVADETRADFAARWAHLRPAKP